MGTCALGGTSDGNGERGGPGTRPISGRRQCPAWLLLHRSFARLAASTALGPQPEESSRRWAESALALLPVPTPGRATHPRGRRVVGTPSHSSTS